jgi:hypothetical protein
MRSCEGASCPSTSGSWIRLARRRAFARTRKLAVGIMKPAANLFAQAKASGYISGDKFGAILSFKELSGVERRIKTAAANEICMLARFDNATCIDDVDHIRPKYG